jgi:gamma-glutamyltranspeptidase/glutathione hydrolase
MDDFSVKEVLNFYGLTGTEPIALHQEKKVLSSMTPTIVEKDGKLFMVVGFGRLNNYICFKQF